MLVDVVHFSIVQLTNRIMSRKSLDKIQFSWNFHIKSNIYFSRWFRYTIWMYACKMDKAARKSIQSLWLFAARHCIIEYMIDDSSSIRFASDMNNGLLFNWYFTKSIRINQNMIWMKTPFLDQIFVISCQTARWINFQNISPNKIASENNSKQNKMELKIPESIE